jgi:hypothetical protein
MMEESDCKFDTYYAVSVNLYKTTFSKLLLPLKEYILVVWLLYPFFLKNGSQLQKNVCSKNTDVQIKAELHSPYKFKN